MIEISCFCENVKQVTQMKVDTTTLEIYLATPIYVNLYITYDATVSLQRRFPAQDGGMESCLRCCSCCELPSSLLFSGLTTDSWHLQTGQEESQLISAPCRKDARTWWRWKAHHHSLEQAWLGCLAHPKTEATNSKWTTFPKLISSNSPLKYKRNVER